MNDDIPEAIKVVVRAMSNEEKEHHWNIINNPNDPAPLLAYAEWLDKNGKDSSPIRLYAKLKPEIEIMLGKFSASTNFICLTFRHTIDKYARYIEQSMQVPPRPVS